MSRGTTIVLRNLSVAHEGGIGIVTSPGVGELKAAIDALKAQFAADGHSRLLIQGLRITGANPPHMNFRNTLTGGNLHVRW
jgi:hypothetical protein